MSKDAKKIVEVLSSMNVSEFTEEAKIQFVAAALSKAKTEGRLEQMTKELER